MIIFLIFGGFIVKETDAFARILPESYYSMMLKSHPAIEKQYPFVKIPALVNLGENLA